MKIDMPTNLIEFILSGILLELVIFILIPDLNLKNDFFIGLILLSGGYILGLGANAISTPFFEFINKRFLFKKIIEVKKVKLNPVKKEIEELFEVDISQDNCDLKQLDRLIDNYVSEISISFRKIDTYQMRIYRMSRISFVISLLWVIVFLLIGFNILPNQRIFELRINSPETFYLILMFLIVLTIALFFSTTKRIKYIIGSSFDRFVAIIKIRSLNC